MSGKGQKRKAPAKLLSRVKSEGEVAILQNALRIAGSPAKLAQWALTPIPSLNGQTPYAALQSPEGRQDVAALLVRIEHGVY